MSLGAKVLLSVTGSILLYAQQPAAPPSSPVLVYQRRPLQVPITCRARDFDATGLQCSEEEPCRLFLELVAVEAVGPKILVVGNIHTASATVSSLALLSDDAGTIWREPLERAPATGFEAAQFLNEQLAWISAQPQRQYASDPYLLATSDGGANWHKLPIWNEEGRAGLLQQFHFDGKDHGYVVIDRSQLGPASGRFELYETPNGGSTWMLKETTSRPITPKWPAQPPAEWRIRVEEKARTYEIERRVGSTWQRMANFRTDLGACKTLETQRAPEPPSPAGAPPPDL